MTPDSVTNYSAALREQRTRIVRADRHRFALPHEPAPGYTRRRSRAQTAALLIGCLTLAIVASALDEMPAERVAAGVVDVEIGR